MVKVKAAKRPNYLSNFLYKIRRSELFISAFVFFISAIIICTISAFSKLYYEHGIFKDILVEAHGFLLDLLILGILFTILKNKIEKRLKVDRLKEEIDDFRGLDNGIAVHRINGIISRLNKLGVTNIDLNSCHLSNIEITQLDLNGSNLTNTNFEETKLIGCSMCYALLVQTNFENTLFQGGQIKNSICHKANFKTAKLYNVSLENSDFTEAIFCDADFAQAKLKGVSLAKANLIGAKNLGLEQLEQAATLWDAKLDGDLYDKLKDSCHLFRKPGNIA
jgi:BTB/POZ domain-containing protein KCTD9